MDNSKIKLILFTWSMNMMIVAFYGFFSAKYQTFLNLRGLFNIIVMLYLAKDFIINDKTSKTILIFVFYLFFLSFFSSNLKLSFEMTVKASIGMLMFLVGKRFFSSEYHFNKLLRYYYFLLILLICAVLFSNIAGIGMRGYSENSETPGNIYYGGLGVAITKLLLIPILLTPVMINKLSKNYNRTFMLLLIFLGLIISIIAFKRSSTMGLIAGALVYALFLKKNKVLKYLVILFMFAFITSPIYMDFIEESYATRSKQLYGISKDAETIEIEGRYWETEAVIDALKTDNLSHVFFGSEIFNEFDYFKTTRMLHIDYNVILNGSGIIGLLVFLLIYYFIIKRSLIFYKIFNNWNLKIISISVISIIVFAIFISIGGSVRSFDFRGPIFLYVGAALGYLERESSFQLKELSVSENKVLD